MKKNKLTKEKKDFVINNYNNLTLVEIGQILKIPKTTLRRYIKILKLPRKNCASDTEIKCSDCKKWKQLSNFSSNKHRRLKKSNICKECSYKRFRLWIKKNPEKILENKIKTKDQRKKYNKRYIKENKETIKKRNHEYYLKHKEEYLKRGRENKKKQYYNNLNFRLSSLLRQTITRTFKKMNIKKTNRTFELLNYSKLELVNHLSKFLNNPCEICKKTILINFPKANYDIEHIIPICSAKSKEDIIKLNQLNNLRLLCKKCNKNKIEHDLILKPKKFK